MAGPKASKRKSSEYVSDDGFVDNGDTSDRSDRPTKRSKNAQSSSKSSHFTSAAKPLVDSDDNPYWEISKMRRVTLSEFKGKQLINVREYYEKDGKDLPGKKGISMTLEQFSTFVELLPQIEKALEAKGEKVPRPIYGMVGISAKEEEVEKEESGGEDNGVRAPGNGSKKSNFEATSDEEED